jgi:hypothetical protein
MVRIQFLAPEETHSRKQLAPLHFAPSKRTERRISGRARPGGKGGARQNHEAHSTTRTGRALYLAWYRAGKSFFPLEHGPSLVGAPGGAPLRPASFCGTTGMAPREDSIPADAFCARRPCPRATSLPLPTERIAKVKGGKPKTPVDKVFSEGYKRNRRGCLFQHSRTFRQTIFGADSAIYRNENLDDYGFALKISLNFAFHGQLNCSCRAG